MTLYVKRPHPNPDEDDILMPLLLEAWEVGENMDTVVSEEFTDPDTEITTRYEATAIKQVKNRILRAFDNIGGTEPVPDPEEPLYVEELIEADFGTWGVKPAENVLLSDSNDIYGYSSPKLVNALAEPLYNSGGSLVYGAGERDQKKGLLPRAWMFRELTQQKGPVRGTWNITEQSAIWSLGFNKIIPASPGVYDLGTGEHPFPQIYGARDQGLINACYRDVDPAGHFQLTASFWDYPFTFYFVFFAGYAYKTQLYDGPRIAVPHPTIGQVYTTTAEMTLSGESPYIPGLIYDCGSVTWTLTWEFL